MYLNLDAVRRSKVPQKQRLDKLCRAIGDALTGVVFADDRQIAAWHAEKVYTVGSEGATAEIQELHQSIQSTATGRWRMRTGDYRVQFRAERNDTADGGWLVVVEKIGHRDGFY